jgi:hypothetical protein
MERSGVAWAIRETGRDEPINVRRCGVLRRIARVQLAYQRV